MEVVKEINKNNLKQREIRMVLPEQLKMLGYFTVRKGTQRNQLGGRGGGRRGVIKQMAWVYRLLVAGIIVKLRYGSPVTRYPSGGIPTLENLKAYLLILISVKRWPHGSRSEIVQRYLRVTKEFIDALPNGWEEYAWRRINKGVLLKRCPNRTLCMEKLALVLPETPPYMPQQYGRCAVIGNSGDVLKTKFGKEIDGYDAVVRENGAPIQNYTEYVGRKNTFRLLNRGSAKALDKVAELDGMTALGVSAVVSDM